MAANITRLNVVKIIDQLLKTLPERERAIILKRYGLKGEKKHTLEKIGKKYDITRERVRQIENNTINKLKSVDSATKTKSKLNDFNIFIHDTLKKRGGVIEQNDLITEITNLHSKANQDAIDSNILFLLNALVDDVEKVKTSDKLHSAWKLSHVNDDLVHQIVDTLIELISGHGEPLDEKKLHDMFVKTAFYKENEAEILALCDLDHDGDVSMFEIFMSYLQIIKKVKKNIFDKWGLIAWQNVQPRKINDKAYLVLSKAGKPLHFSDIADLINKAGFDSKKACAATVHNELILNDQYVLVGRGIYALKEWGYKEGTVIDVIYNILSQANDPMSKDEIVDEVLKRRIVRKSTIYLSLLNKSKFKKVGQNVYTIID